MFGKGVREKGAVKILLYIFKKTLETYFRDI